MRTDTVRVLSSAESSAVSLGGISLSVVKVIADNMETCCPASQTPNPVLTLTSLAFTYHLITHTFQVMNLWS